MSPLTLPPIWATLGNPLFCFHVSTSLSVPVSLPELPFLSPCIQILLSQRGHTKRHLLQAAFHASEQYEAGPLPESPCRYIFITTPLWFCSLFPYSLSSLDLVLLEDSGYI